MIISVALAILFAAQTVLGQYGMPQYLNTKYGGGAHQPPIQSGTKTFTKTKTKTVQTPMGGGKYRGGCNAQPPTPMNAGLRCSQYSGCRADCVPNFQFPNGATTLKITCANGEWQIEGTEWQTVPSCEPICVPPCENSGICIAPDQCNCAENFSGSRCQIENKPCLNLPPMPMNSRRSCKSKSCTITCMAGHQFPDGSAITTMICKSGYWVPSRDTWASIPDCLATCIPPCLNGGNCLSYNVCQCPQELRGPQCQYRAEDCNVRKLQFNGNYNCSGDADSFSCSLNCPEGINFEFRPEPAYTCTYETGLFLPTPIPQCVFPIYMEVVAGAHSSHNTYHLTNNSEFNLNTLQINGLEGMNPEGLGHPYHTIPSQSTQDENLGYKPIGNYGKFEDNIVFIEEKLPEPGVCFTWQGSHYKTFDGKVFSFNSKCAHTLVSDAVDNTFNVVVQNECRSLGCSRIIKLYLQDRAYVFKQDGEGKPVFLREGKALPIPGQVPGIRVEMSAHYMVVFLDTIGVKIQWDGAQLVQVEINEGLWNRTQGLCGKLDGESWNDLFDHKGHKAKTIANLATSWKVEDLENECRDLPTEEHVCQDTNPRSDQALAFCNQLLNDKRFSPCHSIMDITTLLDACRWDYCSCTNADPSECACESMNVYTRTCAHKGIKTLANWRDEHTCPMRCTGGRIYKACGPANDQAMCGGSTFFQSQSENTNCVEGCYCSDGMVLHEDRCITRDQCPCKLRGKSHPAGTQVPKECNTCTCSDGSWVCTQVSCGARCSAVGDPHYTTFDGRKYDFMGQCSYYLVQTPTFSIEAENVACAGSISQAMNLPSSVASGLPSCTKAVTVKISGQTIKLKQNHEVVVNGLDITKVPYQIANVTVRSVSSIFLQVTLPNGIQLWWDGVTRVYIDIPAQFSEKTKGLCGTFNNNQKDDFLTPEGDVEQSIIPFANKWKTAEKCNDVPDKLKSNPCHVNIQNQPIAEKHCSKLLSNLFSECHDVVDPQPFYQDCLFDMCSCEYKVSKCLCPTVSAYAAECSRLGININWREEVRDCGVHCPAGQKYQICGNTCTRSCFDVAVRPDCKPQCVEGCNCPEGEALDDEGECVPIGRCKCQLDGLWFHSGYKEVRAASKGPELCTCVNAQWSCRLATDREQRDFPKADDLKSLCGDRENMEFTTCEPVEPTTCRNMHKVEEFSADVCHAGCKCREGFVVDSSTRKCVRPTECPCHHGGRSYKENATVQNDCNTCKCRNGKWKCTDKPCSAECSAWGDSHFKTFDGKHYDYQGQCDYALAKGSLNSETFSVSIQNVPCGSLGTSCSKSVTIRLSEDTITLTRNKPLPNHISLKHLTVREKGLLVIVEAPDLGLIIQWDKGTRVYIKLDPRWKNSVKGLCGNYNDNESDDFQTPSGGITEASAQIFGDSWKLQPYCPEALEVTNTCEDRPDRKIWALKQCGVLKSPLFSPCHTEVPIDTYLEKCVFDACACDQGGDCECLCTALSAYAQECTTRGVPIRWRSQELCPMQCDERCSNYEPCISTCPLETCDNLLTHTKLSKACSEDTCIEGCAPKSCPPDHIYLNSSFVECVPRNVCKPICLEVEGVAYYEGDLMEEDDCHSCFCSREQKVCKGQPCSTTVSSTTPLPTTHQLEQLLQCETGWTDWFNQDKAPIAKTKTRGKMNDVEPVPTPLLLNNQNGGKCDIDKMVDIECRTVRSHLTPKETGLDVECSLERGLLCQSSGKGKRCQDFEIRIKCECEPPTTPPPACDTAQPHKEHPTDCHKFYHCDVGLNGPEFVEKTCGPSMYYNPVSMICDWPYAVEEIKPECKAPVVTTVQPEEEVVSGNEILPEECPPGMVMDPCAIQCDQLCSGFELELIQKGQCENGVICLRGCVSAQKKLQCPKGMFWANDHTCVSISDCMCSSNDYRPVKPGTLYRESDCKVCQCVDNHYSCNDQACFTTTPEPAVVKSIDLPSENFPEIMNIVSTVTPPEACDENHFLDLVQGDQPLPDEAFNASSVLSKAYEPYNARFKPSDKTGGSWTPEYSNIEQYLQIDLGRQEPIYGIQIKGSPLYDEYVTGYKVYYSPDGEGFLPVLNQKHPQIFRGSIDTNTPVRQIFETPFEAKIVRINPQTWHNGISLRVELIGCGEPTTTEVPYEMITITPTTQKPKLCEDTMGLDDGRMSVQQLSVSSEIDNNHTKHNVNISQESAWQPLTNSPTEFIQFDFLEPRNITGVITKGGPEGWVSTFTLQYSHDSQHWNPIIDKITQKPQRFLGNYDGETPQTNFFDLPINARHFQLITTKWSNNIQMRVEMLGCFKPYPYIEESTTPLVPSSCNYCPGVEKVPLEVGATCRCENDKWWDGQNCIIRAECPCMIGHIAYPVGTTYEKEDCSQCLCKLGGVSHCNPQQCQPCGKDLKITVTSTCKCTCQPCPDGTTLCPTSNICINSTQWCNGVQDCPDDEIDCPTLPPPTTPKPEKKCPEITCPRGYKKDLKKISKSVRYHSYLSPMFSSYGRKNTKTSTKTYSGVKNTGVKGYKSPLQRPILQNSSAVEEKICAEYRCLSNKPPPKFIHGEEECPIVTCPQGYIPVLDTEESSISNECLRYTCNPSPPPDAVCNVTGRTFNTFDNIEYKYDICNHVLARDLANFEWDVSLKKTCTDKCIRDLIIHHEKNSLILHPDLTVEYNNFKYTVDQTKKIGSQTEAFSVSRLGNTLLFVSNRYGFWIIWDQHGNVKLGTVRKLIGKIDGLCGFFNENPEDDKRKPDGSPARTTEEFGDSWGQADQPCETKTCPTDSQSKAWTICNRVKDQILAPCSRVVDIEAFISRCLETTCECLQSASGNYTAEEECRCTTLQSFVADCLASGPGTDLSEWRMQLDCPVTCASPLVYHDCYQRKCEPTCESISDPNICAKLPNVCFPGCYCPAGYVKKGDTCIKPSSCRDCECNVLPHLQYVTYDDANFTVHGNCVYVMSRDANIPQHRFQVLITNAPCKTNEKKTCVGKVTILYEGRKIHILNDLLKSRLKFIVDGERIDDFQEIAQWAQVRETAAKHFKILLTDVQVEVSVYYPSLGVSVKAPSHKYAGKLEGLCGDCNKDREDDIRTPSGTPTKDITEFALSWLYEKLPGGQTKEMCMYNDTKECPPLPDDADPCSQLLDMTKFGQCLTILDPMMFFEWCQKDTCDNHPELACTAIEAYARDCASAGFCVNWRTDLCPAKECPHDQIYDPCGTSCPETCDSLKTGKKKCSIVPVEGCFCQKGQVFRNQTCVTPKDCEVCDEEGHHPGDEWKKDKCTNCKCVGTTLECQAQACPALGTICERGFQAIQIPTKDEECCEKYACFPEPTMGPTCETPQKMVCGNGQILKLDTKPNGCQQFICECKPLSECDPIDTSDKALEDGYMKEIDESGCCPILNIVCQPQLCPKPKLCEQYHSLKNQSVAGKCCPLYTCEPPKDKCIFETVYTAAIDGGERPRTKFEMQKMLKKADEEWNDGPCRQCKCSITSLKNYQAVCSQSECSAIELSQDFPEYQLEPELVYNQCCPNIKRVACKYYNKIYPVGEKWIKDGNFCATYECVNSTSGVRKDLSITKCPNECEPGSEYIPASANSKQCCGSCKPYACVVDGKVHKEGENWQSDDFCINYYCLNVNGSMQVQSVVVNCPEPPPDHSENFVIKVESTPGECCKNYVTTACKVQGKVYHVGETWPSLDGDKCKNITCVEKDKGELKKQESVETCKKECLLGWKYEESNHSCCGKCVQVACVVDGSLKAPSENWSSPDNCTTYRCEGIGGQLLVSAEQESCPDLQDCPPENIYLKGCCSHCNHTTAAQLTCGLEEIPLVKTLNTIKVLHGNHGACTNKKPIHGLGECIGNCQSSTFFNFKSGNHESACSCCQATSYGSIDVELECEDGYQWKKKLSVPLACGCEGCAATTPKASFTKSKTFVKS